MKRGFRCATTLSLAIFIAGGAAINPVAAQFNFGQVNWAQVPTYIDTSSRLTGIEKRLVEEFAAGRLTQTQLDTYKKDVDRIRSAETSFRADGKLSVWERMRLVVELDKLDAQIQSGLGTRTTGITDVPGREADISKTVSEAVITGRLTAQEAEVFRQMLDQIKAKEATFKIDGSLSQTEVLTLSVDLDKLSSDIDQKLRARVISDPGIDAKQAELATKIDSLVSTGKISSVEAEPLKQELARINTRKEAFKLTGGGLSSDEVLTLALELERLSGQVTAYNPAQNTTQVKSIGERQTDLRKSITEAQTSGKLTIMQTGELMQELNRIETLEATYRIDGVLSDAEILTLARDLDNLKTRVTNSTQAATLPGIDTRKDALKKKLTDAEAASRVTPNVATELKMEMERIEQKERFYRADGTLNDTETLVLASDLDALAAKLEQSLSALPNINDRKRELETRLNESLASGRLSPTDADAARQDLARIGQLESTFRASEGLLSDQEVVSLNREYDAVKSRLERSMTPLPDVAAKRLDLEKKLTAASTAGTISVSAFADLKKEFDRIAGMEASFRSSDSSLNDWETMTVNRDLDRLANDMQRVTTTVSVTTPKIDTSKSAPDTRGHWAEPYIAVLSERGTIGGFPDGSFKPDDGITRAQFAAIAVKALGLPDAGRPANFKDVSAKYWANKAIANVSDAGLVTGFPDGTFRPEDKITRAQALVILAKALPGAQGTASELSRYGDGNEVPLWALPSVAKAAQAGILVNYPDPQKIRPTSFATRAEVAALTYQSMANLGQKLPPLKVGLEASGK